MGKKNLVTQGKRENIRNVADRMKKMNSLRPVDVSEKPNLNSWEKKDE